MPRTPQEVGDAWGRLFALAVDACQSHHAAHCGCPSDGDDSGRRKRRVPDGEIDDVTVSAAPQCPDSWTGAVGEVRVNYDAPTQLALARPALHHLPADGPLAAQAHPATAPANVPPGYNAVVVAMVQPVPPSRGLYVGRLCPVTGGDPDIPVLIHLDDVT